MDSLHVDIETLHEAQWFVDQMRDGEILFVGLTHQGWKVHEIGRALGLGRTTAYKMRDRVIARLGDLKADGDNPGIDAKMLAAKICAGRLTELRHLIDRDDVR